MDQKRLAIKDTLAKHQAICARLADELNKIEQLIESVKSKVD